MPCKSKEQNKEKTNKAKCEKPKLRNDHTYSNLDFGGRCRAGVLVGTRLPVLVRLPVHRGRPAHVTRLRGVPRPRSRVPRVLLVDVARGAGLAGAAAAARVRAVGLLFLNGKMNGLRIRGFRMLC